MKREENTTLPGVSYREAQGGPKLPLAEPIVVVGKTILSALKWQSLLDGSQVSTTLGPYSQVL